MKLSIYSLMIVSLLTSSSVFFSSRTAFAEPMSSGTYSIESDSVNFEGARSTSGSYGLEDTAGEVGTGYSSSAALDLHAGYQQNVAAAATPVDPGEPTPSSNGSPSGTSIYGSSINVLGFAATPLSSSILLTWQYPPMHNIVAVRIMRSTAFFPAHASDGELVFEGSYGVDLTQAIDNDVNIDTLYYYTLFALDTRGSYSSGVLAYAYLPVVGEPTVTPTDPFGTIPMATDIHPAFQALTLTDFDFIQEGILIAHAGTTVVIDGSKNLTVRLAYKKVPEMLKTIAITLADPEDTKKIFTFLLRVNSDKTAYEATIAPLGKGGNYELRAIILDYQNQGLKRLEGTLRASIFESGNALDIHTKTGLWFWLLLFLICAVIVYVEIRRRRHVSNTGQGNITFTS